MVLLKTWKHGENINVREEIFLCTTLPLLSSCWFTCIIEGLLFNWKSTHSIHLNVEGVLSNPTGLIYCKYLDWYFWIGVRGSYVIYITTNGVGGFALLDSSKKHHTWTQSHRQPTCYCLFVFVVFLSTECTNPQSLLSCYNTPDVDSWSEAGGVFHHTPVLVFGLFFLYICGMTEKPIALIFHYVLFHVFSTAATTAYWSEIMSCLFQLPSSSTSTTTYYILKADCSSTSPPFPHSAALVCPCHFLSFISLNPVVYFLSKLNSVFHSTQFYVILHSFF